MSSQVQLILVVMELIAFLVFGVTGAAKLFTPIPVLGRALDWVNAAPPLLVRFIGACEVLGALALVVPRWTGTMTWTTPVAALGLTAVMVGAMGFHLWRHELRRFAVPAVMALITGSVAITTAVGLLPRLG